MVRCLKNTYKGAIKLKYNSPTIYVFTEMQLLQRIKVLANSGMSPDDCMYYGAYSIDKYQCDIGVTTGYNNEGCEPTWSYSDCSDYWAYHVLG